MCPELDEPWLVSGPFLHELIGAHVRVQTFSTFAEGDALHLAPQLFVTRIIDGVTLTTFT